MAGLYDTAEQFFGAIGGNHPVGRFFIGVGMTILVMEAIKPDFAYYPGGQRRDWSFLSNEESNTFSEDGGASLTNVPFWLPPAVIGTIAATFV